MKISSAEFKVLEQVANGNKHVPEIARALKKSNSQIYRMGKKLINKELLTLSDGSLQPMPSVHVNFLFQLLIDFPSSAKPLSGVGIKIFTALLEPKQIEELISETSLKRSTIFKKLREARSISMIRRSGNKDALNEKLWQKAIDFLRELKSYESNIDRRIPSDAQIYFKNEKEIVFSSREEIDAALTAFSAYEKYGIKLLNIIYYYYLPKKGLAKKQVFLHSLHIAEKEKDYKLIIFVALFYAKFRNELSNIKHPLIEKINKLLKGGKIQGYPSLDEIKDRADVYGIRI